MKKQKKRKKRKLDSYAMGSGNTGVVKNYMPDPNEAFRQNDINVAKAVAEGGNDPLVIGLDMMAGLIQAIGPGITGSIEDTKTDANKKNTASAEKILKTAPRASATTDGGFPGFAVGTGPNGTPTLVNAEAGEIIETPNGQKEELKGKKHSQGGENIEVPQGTRIFSDQLQIDGKTMADRKKARERKLNRAKKAVKKDPTDAIAKGTLKKVQEAFDYEEQNDLMIQGFAKQLDETYANAFGTGEEGVEGYATGTGWEGVNNFFKGFTGGDALSLAGNLYSGIAPLVQAKKVAADDTPNPNYYEGFGQDALSTMEDAGATIDTQKALAEKKLASNRTSAVAQARASSRGVNQTRAMQLGIDANTNKAMGDLYSNFSKLMMDNLYKKAGLETQIDQAVMTGAKEADIANRMDKDNAATQIGVAQGNLGTAIQMMGKDLNANAVQQYMNNLYEHMFANPVKLNRKGELEKSDD